MPANSVLARPVVVARAEVGSVTTDVPSDELGIDDSSHATAAPKGGAGANVTSAAAMAEAAGVRATQATNDASGTIEDTHTHAIDPVRSEGSGRHALDSDDDDAPVAAASASEPPAAPPPAVTTVAPTVTTTAAAASTDTPPAEKTPMAAPAAATAPAAEAVPAMPAPATPVVAAPVTEATPAAAPAPVPAALIASMAPAPSAPPAPAPAASPSSVLVAAAAAPAQASAAPAATVASTTVAPTATAEAAPAAAAPTEIVKAEPAPVQVAAAPTADAPSLVETKLDAGTKAVAVEAAEPRSTAPLRILVTRRTQRDRIIGVQRILSDLGYLDPQDFDGTLGKATANAIKAFQKANNMQETGAFTDDLVKKVYEVAGKGEPPLGHIFVRQAYSRLFDAPVGLTNPDEPLGTHVYTAMKFGPGDTKVRWMAVTVQGGSPEEALNRIQIPDDVRQRISERLTPGSTLIIGDTSINSATLPKGGDFVVLAKYSSPKTAANAAANAAADSSDDQPAKRKKTRSARRNFFNYNYGYNAQRSFRSYPGWPW